MTHHLHDAIANVYLISQQSIKLLTIEYQKGHTPYEEWAHFLVQKVEGGGHRAPVPPFHGPRLLELVGEQY